jgi:hypothetical protein
MTGIVRACTDSDHDALPQAKLGPWERFMPPIFGPSLNSMHCRTFIMGWVHDECLGGVVYFHKI